MILKQIFNYWGVRLGSVLKWLPTWYSGGFCEYGNEVPGSTKYQRIS
jgi:hypothetical protein